jgi:hypothetical protein
VYRLSTDGRAQYNYEQRGRDDIVITLQTKLAEKNGEIASILAKIKSREMIVYQNVVLVVLIFV